MIPDVILRQVFAVGIPGFALTFRFQTLLELLSRRVRSSLTTSDAFSS